MIAYLRKYLEYKKYNKIFSRNLGIRRDLKVECYLFRNIPFFMAFDNSPDKIKLLKRNLIEEKLRKKSPGYYDYYKDSRQLVFKEMNYIACRIASSYMLDKNLVKLENELEYSTKKSSIFCENYIKEKVLSLLDSVKNEISFDKLRAAK